MENVDRGKVDTLKCPFSLDGRTQVTAGEPTKEHGVTQLDHTDGLVVDADYWASDSIAVCHVAVSLTCSPAGDRDAKRRDSPFRSSN
jgi:hypothetical protein